MIDESMVPFRGRLSFKQYIPNKTHRYGVKLYKLCTISGYTYNLKVYTGKGDTQPELGHAQTVVLKLLEDLNPKEGRILYADNFYSGIPLVKTLLDQKCLYCGTLRSNRKGVPKYFTKKIKRGEIIGKEKKKIKIMKWVDKRPVYMITTQPAHNTTLVPTGKNIIRLFLKFHKKNIFLGKKNRKGEDILKPICVIDYNSAKKGVDFSDQMSSYHTVLRKSLKWYR